MFFSIISIIPFSRPLSLESVKVPPSYLRKRCWFTQLSPRGGVLWGWQEANRRVFPREPKSPYVLTLCSSCLSFAKKWTSQVELSCSKPKIPEWEMRLLLYVSERSRWGPWGSTRSNSGFLEDETLILKWVRCPTYGPPSQPLSVHQSWYHCGHQDNAPHRGPNPIPQSCEYVILHVTSL